MTFCACPSPIVIVSAVQTSVNLRQDRVSCFLVSALCLATECQDVSFQMAQAMVYVASAAMKGHQNQLEHDITCLQNASLSPPGDGLPPSPKRG